MNSYVKCYLEDKNGTEQYRIIPDYPNYRECGQFGMIINKWNGKKVFGKI